MTRRLRYVPTGKGAAESNVRQLWLFILLSIATCGRGERVSRVQLQFISWFADSLTVQIPTSKSDIEGLMSYAKMCAANPWNPLCCLVTALGVDLVSRDGSSNFENLFGVAGDSTVYTTTRLHTALGKILRIVGEDNLGAPLHRLTGHFLKKTGVAFLRSMHECLSHDSLELRADHKVGPYCHRSDQDAIAGRSLAFLKPGSDEFSVAPPHFHPRIVAAIPWAEIVPGYNLYSFTTKIAVHACVASVVHNHQFIDKNLSSSHPYHGCRLRKTQGRWLSLLQPYVLGGRSGFKSIMQATGQSLISSIAVDLRLVRQRGVSCCGTVLDEAVTEIAELKHAVDRLTQAVQGSPALASTGEISASQTVFPIAYLPASFRFPVGISTEDCWNRWHDARYPLRSITIKMLPVSMLPAERGRQMCVRRKIKGVMGIIQGQTPDKIVDIDPSFVWKACWARCVSFFCIQEPCTWTVGTLYDFLLKQSQRVKEARAAPSIAFAEAAAAAATVTAKAAQDAATFAVAAAAHPPVRAVIVTSSAVVELVQDAAAIADAGARAIDAEAFALDVTTDQIISPYSVPLQSIVENIQLQSMHAAPVELPPPFAQQVEAAKVSMEQQVEAAKAVMEQQVEAAKVSMEQQVQAAKAVMEPGASADVEYGPKNGVRCLCCNKLYFDKTGWNKHLVGKRRVNPDCLQVRAYRFVYKRPRDFDESAATSAALIYAADK